MHGNTFHGQRKWPNTTFLELEFHKLKFQMVLEFMKIEFLISFAIVALLRWKLVCLFNF